MDVISVGFSAGCLGDSFKVFVPTPDSAGVGVSGFLEPSLLLAKKAFGFSCNPRLVDFTRCGFCWDVVFHNCTEVFLDTVPQLIGVGFWVMGL